MQPPYLCSCQTSKKEKRRDDENNQQEDLPLIEIARRILDASGLKGVVMNSRIFACLRMQMNKVLKSASKAMRAGGKSFKKLEECWKSGQKTYSFKVYFMEVDMISVTEENKILLEQKRKAEEELIKTRDKYRKLAVKEKSWKQKMRRVIKKLKEQNQKKRVRGKTLNKSFSDYSDRQKIRIKKTIKEECQTTLTFLGLYNLVPAKVEIYNEEQNKMEVIPLLDDDEFLKNIDSLDKDSDASLTDQ